MGTKVFHLISSNVSGRFFQRWKMSTSIYSEVQNCKYTWQSSDAWLTVSVLQLCNMSLQYGPQPPQFTSQQGPRYPAQQPMPNPNFPQQAMMRQQAMQPGIRPGMAAPPYGSQPNQYGYGPPQQGQMNGQVQAPQYSPQFNSQYTPQYNTQANFQVSVVLECRNSGSKNKSICAEVVPSSQRHTKSYSKVITSVTSASSLSVNLQKTFLKSINSISSWQCD